MILNRVFNPVTKKYCDESTPEYLKIKEYSENKKLRDMKNYECRTGHLTQLAIEGRSLLDEVVEYTYVIVYPSTPKILIVWEYSRGPVVELIAESRLRYGSGSSIPIWGYGETEEDAWNMALEDIV